MAYPPSETHDAVFSIPGMSAGPKLGIVLRGHALAEVDFLAATVANKPPVTEPAQQVVAELMAYFANPAWKFSLPLAGQGTAFQQRVWQALQQIPSGEVCSYSQLAEQLHTGARAIGNACRRNPIPIIVPCHRVVALHGLGGYSGHVVGEQLALKSWLLAHESRH